MLTPIKMIEDKDSFSWQIELIMQEFFKDHCRLYKILYGYLVPSIWSRNGSYIIRKLRDAYSIKNM